MSRDEITQAMAESGKMKLKDLMSYMKVKYSGKYDIELAKEIAKDLIKQMN